VDPSWALMRRVERTYKDIQKYLLVFHTSRTNINVQKNYNPSYLPLLDVPTPVVLVVLLLQHWIPRLHPAKFKNKELSYNRINKQCIVHNKISKYATHTLR
jgi:hypothetical protein